MAKEKSRKATHMHFELLLTQPKLLSLICKHITHEKYFTVQTKVGDESYTLRVCLVKGGIGWMKNNVDKIKVIDIVPIPVSIGGMYHTTMCIGIEMSTFCTGLNTSRTSHLLAIPVDFGHYWLVLGIPAGTKNVFIFFYFFNFVFFEFL